MRTNERMKQENINQNEQYDLIISLLRQLLLLLFLLTTGLNPSVWAFVRSTLCESNKSALSRTSLIRRIIMMLVRTGLLCFGLFDMFCCVGSCGPSVDLERFDLIPKVGVCGLVYCFPLLLEMKIM